MTATVQAVVTTSRQDHVTATGAHAEATATATGAQTVGRVSVVPLPKQGK